MYLWIHSKVLEKLGKEVPIVRYIPATGITGEVEPLGVHCPNAELRVDLCMGDMG